MSASRPTLSSPRLEWSEVPDHVGATVESDLGATVVSATTQPGGFSPGAVARVVLSNGRRVFVKLCGSEINPDTPDLNRAEVAALRVLAEDVPAPRLVMSCDGGEWVALVMEDVEGRRPGVPWTDSDVAAVSTSLERAASVRGIEALPAFADIVHARTAWDEVAADPADVRHRLVARLPEMLDLQARAREVTRGESLVHWDARNNNVLIRPDGEAALLDERQRRPVPPGNPTIRAWQARCASASLERLEEGTRCT